jgi:chromosome segregation ATPase
MEISKALQKIIENPDDLSTLPQIVAKVQELENRVQNFTEIEQQYMERIERLQEINRSYLAQIPIPGQEQKEEDPEPEVTLEDAKKELINAMNKIGGINNG